MVWVAALFGFFIPLAACVMELSSRYPEEGGIYVWTREAFGDFSGFHVRVGLLDEQSAVFCGGALLRRGFGAVCVWRAGAGS